MIRFVTIVSLIGSILTLFKVHAANNCSTVFKNSQLVVVKTEITSLDRYTDYVTAYNELSDLAFSFITKHNQIGENKPYPIAENPIPNFLDVTEKMLVGFENDPVILKRMGHLLHSIWFHSLLLHNNPNRALLKIGDDNNEIDLAAEWSHEDRGILRLIYVFLSQKNHTSESISSFGDTLAFSLGIGINNASINADTAKNIVSTYETAISKLPIEDQQFLFSNYMFNMIHFQSTDWAFKREKLILYLNRLVESKAKIQTVPFTLLTNHLSKKIDVQLGEILIKLNARIADPTSLARDYRLSEVKEQILGSELLTKAQKKRLIAEAEWSIAQIISQ